MAQEEKSPFEGVDESTSFLDLLRRAIKSSPAAEVGAEATGIPSVARVASGDSSTLDKADAALTLADLLLPMVPIAALYHGTSGLRLPGIMRRGILPRREADVASNQLATAGKRMAAFASEDPHVASQFAATKAATDARALGKQMAEKLGLSPDAAEFIIRQLETRIPGVVLDVSESVRPSGIPDEVATAEKALMFPQGIPPTAIESGRSFPPEAVGDYDFSEFARMSSPQELEAEGEAIGKIVQRILQLAKSQ